MVHPESSKNSQEHNDKTQNRIEILSRSHIVFFLSFFSLHKFSSYIIQIEINAICVVYMFEELLGYTFTFYFYKKKKKSNSYAYVCN